MNALLGSLCHLQPQWFLVAIATVEQLLQSPGTTKGRVLQTIAHCALSNECMSILLKSNILNLITSSLSSSLSSLDNPHPQTYSSVLESICSDLAFLTDIVFGHREAQNWVIQSQNAFFWPEMLKKFNEPCEFFTEGELAFCQHTVQQFFAVCTKFSTAGKQLFINLLTNALQCQYSLEPALNITGPLNLKLTPFTRTLLIDHLLGPEAVHVIIEADPVVLASTQQKLNLNSLIPTYDSPHYHPSYPIDCIHYYLKLSSENSLSRLLSLIVSDDRPKPKDPKLSDRIKQKKVLDPFPSKPPPPETHKQGPSLDIFNLSFLKGPESSPKSSNDVVFVNTEDPHTIMSLNTKIREIEASKLYGFSHTRAITVTNSNEDLDDSPKHPESQNYISMLEIFTHSGGLRLLAHLFPQLHMSLWQQSSSAVPHKVNTSLLPSLTPGSFLPSHTYILFGLCLRLKHYGQIICSNTVRNNVWFLLRGVLGATEDGE